MKLNFLNNPQQRIATGKRLPTKPLECIIMYGTAEQRLKAVKKVLPVAFSLSQHQETSKVIITLLKFAGNTAKVELLFSIRRKLIDLSRSKVGNYVMQELVSCVPKVQQKEISREFVEDFLRLCQHPFSHRVVMKMVALRTSRDELEESLKENIQGLSEHKYGQHVISSWIEHSDEGCELVAEKLDIEACVTADYLAGESTVVCSLLSSPYSPLTTKQEILELVADNLDELFEHRQHNFLIRAAFQYGEDEDREKIIKFFLKDGRMAALFDEKAWVGVAIAMTKFGTDDHRKSILKELGSLAEAAESATRTMVLRALIERGAAATATAKDASFKPLMDQVAELAKSPVGSPVLQLILEFGSDDLRVFLSTFVKKNLKDLMCDATGSYIVQSVLSHGAKATAAAPTVAAIAKVVLDDTTVVETIQSAAGTRVVQNALQYADDAKLISFTEAFLAAGIKDLCLNCHAAYTIRVLLQMLNARCPDLIETRRELMKALKPIAFSLALSPWAGRIVFDAMLEVASVELQTAMKNVIYLKAENWLSEVPIVAPAGTTRGPKQGGGDGDGSGEKRVAAKVPRRDPDTAHMSGSAVGRRSFSEGRPKKKARA